MADEQSLFLRRMQELASRAEGWYTFSDFLTPAEQSWLLGVLDAARSVGISLGEGLLMTPMKSISAIIGVKRK